MADRIVVNFTAVRNALLWYANASQTLPADHRADMVALHRRSLARHRHGHPRPARQGRRLQREEGEGEVAILQGAPFGPNEFSQGNRHLSAIRAIPGGETAFMAYNNMALSIVGADEDAAAA